ACSASSTRRWFSPSPSASSPPGEAQPANPLYARLGTLDASLPAVLYLRGDVRGLVPPAVFKTVRGALLRRPGWVRFPSIPARAGGRDSQQDSPSASRTRASTTHRGLLRPCLKGFDSTHSRPTP